MKKTRRDKFRREYRREDLGNGVRGKYAKAYRSGTNLVLLDPEIAAVFPTDRAVNQALGSLIKAAEQAGLTSRSTGRGRGCHAACGVGSQASRAPAAAPV